MLSEEGEQETNRVSGKAFAGILPPLNLDFQEHKNTQLAQCSFAEPH
jgi:hypothetical protein